MSHRDWLICVFIVDLFRSRAALEAEILVLRQQIVVLRRGEPTRPPIGAIDRLVLGWLCWHFRPRVTRWPWFGRRRCCVGAERVFRSYWGWKSKRRSGPMVVGQVCWQGCPLPSGPFLNSALLEVVALETWTLRPFQILTDYSTAASRVARRCARRIVGCSKH
jgi:hypothetical protein